MSIPVVAALLIPTIYGLVLVALILRNDRTTGLFERLCMSFPLGMSFVTMQMFVLGLFRVPLTLMPITALLATEAVGLSLLLRKKDIPLAPRPKFPLYAELTGRGTGRKVILSVLVLWVLLKVGSIFFETSLRPIYAWDTWANWSVGAKLFYYSKSLYLDVPAGDYFGRGAVSRFLSYPVHNPLMQVWISLWAGGFDEVLVKFTSPMYLACAAGFLAAAIGREAGRIAALALVAIFLGSPLLSYHAVEGYSDFPLSVYLMLALASFSRALRGERDYWLLTGLFSAQALFTKDEAFFIIAPLAVSAMWHIMRTVTARRDRRKTILLLGLPLLFVAPWYVFKFTHGFGFGADSAKLEFTFHPEILVQAFMNVLSLDNFAVVPVLFPALLVAAGKPDRTFLHLLAPLACYILFFHLLYAFTPYYYHYFSNGTVFYRNILTYYASLIFLTAFLVRRIRDRMRLDPQPQPVGKRQRRSA